MIRNVTATTLMLASLSAGASDCSDSIDSYNSAIGEVASTLRRYQSCVSNSEGKDDCSSEFRRLRNAHDGFESAVSGIRSNCEDY